MKTVQEHAKYYKKNKKKEVSKNILVVANLLQEFQSELNEEAASFPDLNDANRLVISAKFVDAIKNLDKKWQELAVLTGELNPHLYRVFVANASPRTFGVIWELRDIHFWGMYTEEKHKAILKGDS